MIRRRSPFALICVLALVACGGPPQPSGSGHPTVGSMVPSGRPVGSAAVSSGPSVALPTIGGTWTVGVRTPSRRAENAAVAVDGVIYVAGGMDIHGATVDLFEAFDTRTRTWSSLPPL